MADALPFRAEIFYDGEWHDITADVRGLPATDGGVSIGRGRRDWASQVDAGKSRFALNNRDGRYSPRNPTSPLYGKVAKYTPVRLWMGDSIRAAHEIHSWPQRWIVDKANWVPMQAAGILRRLSRGDRPLESALRRHYLAYNGQLVGYVPLEEPREAFRTATNLVAGARAIKYGAGSESAGYPLLPDWGGDDTCPGSAPGPEWPVIEYFPWSLGAGTIQHIAPWQVCVSIRVPPGSPEAWLGEWITDGTLPRWELRLTSGGLLRVRAFTDDPEVTPRTQTWTSTADPVDDGQWRSAAVTAVSDGSGGTIVSITVHGADEEFSSVSSMEPGQVTNFRPRPLFVDTSSDPEPIGLLHMAVIGSQSDDIIALPGNPGPADGHAGERAATRIRRIGDESDVWVRLPGLEQMLDRFERTESGGWGDDWSVSGDATFSVDGSSGVMEMDVGQEGVASTDVTEPDDIDVLVAVEVDADPADTAIRSVSLRNQNYVVAIDPLFLTFDLYRWSGASYVAVASVDFTQSFLAAGLIWIRAQAFGSRVRARLWHDTHPEPIRWYIDFEDDDPWLDTGSSAVQGSQIGSDPVTLHWRHFELRAYDTSVPLGPQPTSTEVAAMRDAADTDDGILHEDRERLGLAYRSLSTMVNQEAAVELVYQRPSGTGDVHDMAPEDDDQGLANRMEVSRTGGATAVAELEEGRLSTRDPLSGIGIIPGRATVNAPSDDDLPSHAGWRLRRSTVDEIRWPNIGVNLARLMRTGREALAEAVAAIDSGDRLIVTDLPPDLPPEDVDQLVHGYEERLDDQTWTWAANTTPHSPLWVLEWADPDDTPGPDDPVRFDSGGSTVAAEFEAGTDTSLSVAIGTGHPLWDTDADFPLDIQVAGVRLRVTAISGSSSPQTMTVQQTPINGVEKTIDAGERVRLYRSVPWAL